MKNNNKSYANVQLSDFDFLVAQATKAPSGHNTQPWLFKQTNSSIEIHPDFTRKLPAVDPSNRELFVSLGCAAENLCLAANSKGYKAAVSVDDGTGVITVSLTKRSVEADPLFVQIDRRQTNRSVYSGKEIPSEILNKLQSVYPEKDVEIHFYQKNTTAFNDIAAYIFEANELQMQTEAFKSELKSWMRFNKKHQDQTHDGLSYAVFGAPNVPRFIAEVVMSAAINAKSQNKADRKKIISSSHLVLFTAKGNTLRGWVNLGRTLQKFLLTATELGISHAYLNQPNEEVNIAQKMAKTLGIDGEYPVILLRIGYGKIQAYSKRRDVREVIIPQ